MKPPSSQPISTRMRWSQPAPPARGGQKHVHFHHSGIAFTGMAE
jgi:hypothetical protein